MVKKIVKWILFAVLFSLLSLLIIFYLDLANGPMWILFIELAAIVTLLVLSILIPKKLKLVRFASVLGFIAVTAVMFILAKPTVERTKAVNDKNPEKTEVLTLANGKVQGVYNSNKTVEVYAGIPYAKAPVGELRWKEPQDVENWEGVRDCSTFAPKSMQAKESGVFNTIKDIYAEGGWHPDFNMYPLEEASEDSLYLNIWRPAGKTNLPILVYIHGGSLTSGRSSQDDYNGEAMARQGIIMITIAYRLGMFGYFAHNDLISESPNNTTGNYGLLDQIAALNWVRENIAAFGGDPDRITIAGESAGSSSVNAICVSPLTEGLFNYAIAESSGILAYKPFHTFRDYSEAIEQGNMVREEFNAKSSMELRNIPAEELVKTASNQSAMTVDGYAIVEQPYLTYEKGENHEKALLNGFNAKEADAFNLGIKATAENYEELLAEDMGDYASDMAKVVPADSPQRDQHFIVDAMGDAKGALNQAYSAIWFSYSHYLWNNYMVKQGKPAYEYYFTKTNNSLSNYHAGEIPYAYGNLWRHPGLYNEDDYKLSDIMQQYFVNFAKTGDPNGEGLPKWEARTVDNNLLLQLDTKIKMTEDPNEKLYDIIDKYEESLK